MSPVVRSPPRQGHSGPEHGTAHAGGAGVRPCAEGKLAGEGSRRPAPGTRLSRAGLSLPVHEARRRGGIRIPRVKGGVHTPRRVKRFFSFLKKFFLWRHWLTKSSEFPVYTRTARHISHAVCVHLAQFDSCPAPHT